MAELKPGDQAPDFEATNDQNEKVRLGDLRGQRRPDAAWYRSLVQGTLTEAGKE